MLQISQRGQLMPPSPISKLVPFAEAAKKKGLKVYHLNIGQPDIETPKMILDAVRHS
jgi:aspartate aminotransferase